MAELKGSKTHGHLKEAFAGESQANRRYLYFAKQADIEGYPDVGGLFRDTAEAETGHAHGHLDHLRRVGDPATGKPIGATDKNLASAVHGETYEYTEMYPPMLQLAEADKHKAKRMFNLAAKAEAVHAKLYQSALDSLLQGKDLAETNFYLCPVCGHIELGQPPESCPICGTRRERFTKL